MGKKHKRSKAHSRFLLQVRLFCQKTCKTYDFVLLFQFENAKTEISITHHLRRISSASADFQRQQGFYRRWFPIGRTSPFLFAWLLFLKSRQFAHVKRKSTDKCAIGGGRNHRLSLQHGPATGLSIQCRLGNKHKSGPGWRTFL